MEANVFIHSQDVKVLGEEEQSAEIIVDLSKVWDQMLSRCTAFYAIGHLQIPILEKDEEGHFIKKVMQLKLAQIFQVNEVVDQQVVLRTVYSELIQEDSTRIPTADVELIAYSVEKVEEKENA